MAEKLDTYNWTLPAEKGYARRTYPWHQWLDGDIWRLVRGEDFEAHPLMMERIIRTRATGYKTGVQVRHEPYGDDPEFGVIIVQRTKGQTPGVHAKKEDVPVATPELEALLEAKEQNPLRPVRPARAALTV